MARTLRRAVEPGPAVRLPTGRLLRLLVPVGLLVLVLAAGPAVAIGSGEPVRVAIGAVLLALLVLGSVTVFTQLLGSRRGRLDVEDRPEGLTLPPATTVRWLAVGTPVLGLAFALLLVLGGVLGLDIGPRTASPGVGAVLVILIVGSLVRRPRGTGPSPRVVLGPDGVTHWSRGRATSAAWDEIGDVRLRTEPAVQLVVSRAGTWDGVGGRDLVVALAMHSSDPRLVEAVVRHYWRTPGDRSELGTERAVERIEHGVLAGG